MLINLARLKYKQENFRLDVLFPVNIEDVNFFIITFFNKKKQYMVFFHIIDRSL